MPPSSRPTPEQPVRVAVADDHPLWVRAVVAMLEGAEGVEVVATCTSGPVVLERCASGVDVLLLDYQMPPGDALDVLRELRARGSAVRVVVLSAFAEASMVRNAMQWGARGYLSKTETLDELPDLLREVAGGGTVLSEEARSALEGAEASDDGSELSPREQQVLALAAGGLTDDAIARRLEVSPHTIRTYLRRIFAKLGAANRAEAVALAKQGPRAP